LRRSTATIALSLSTLLLVTACGGAGAGPSASGGLIDEPAGDGDLVIYSGRSEELVGPLIERFETESGLDVQVQYAGTTDLAATILEEGDASPADVFFAQDAGALGAVGAAGRLATLPAATLDQVDARFTSDDDQWVGISGRARVVAYDTRTLQESDLPTSIDGFTDPAWSGRIGWAPTNASFQSFVTAYRVLRGDDAAKAWLEGIQANEPKVYEGNDAVLAAIAAGEVEVGFINHYYLLRQIDEQGEDYPVRNHFLPAGDPGSLVNVAGVGILSTAPHAEAAQRFVDFLLTEETQRYFAEQTEEYPLVAGVEANAALPPLSEIESPDIDLSDLSDLEDTLHLLQDAGVL
jgi:iron(III) transport system substrate-binding protein